jgi:flagellar basal-body rod protein FlgB
MDLINSLTTEMMGKTLDGLAKRHKAIASNLANVDTPNYHRRDVSFEGALEQAVRQQQKQGYANQRPASNDDPMLLKTTRPAHIAMGQAYNSLQEFQPDITESNDLEYRMDGNSVDVESEMVQLARNTQKYQAVSNLESRNFKSIKNVISGGGG